MSRAPITAAAGTVPAFACTTSTQYRRTAAAAMVAALRRCQGDALAGGNWSGRAVDARALATAAVRPAMLRRAQGPAVPPLGLAIILDGSSSMGSRDAGAPLSRRATAVAVGAGIVDAARALQLPVALMWHTDAAIHSGRTARGWAQHLTGGGNRDALAVRSAFHQCERFAERLQWVLVCDGAPCVDEEPHRATAHQVRASMARRGDSLLALLVTEDRRALDRMRSDWGARNSARVSDAREFAHAAAAAIHATTARA